MATIPSSRPSPSPGVRRFAAAVLWLVCPAAAWGQEHSLRETYYHQLPAMPRLVGQTQASARFALYGDAADPAYTDLDPVDGVDDARARLLMRLSERFSPILRRNNISVPRDFWAMLRDPGASRLHRDTWFRGRRLAADSVDLAARGLSYTSSDGSAPVSSDAAVDDDKLLDLVREFHPDRAQPVHVSPEDENHAVLYLDFPGNDERSWRDEARRFGPDQSRIYAHPFIYEDPTATGENRYQLVMQYWLFYPFNDGANNHEGDWEHINVSITTRRRASDASGLLTAADLEQILASPPEAPLDSLVIRNVDYYFHYHMMTLDYLPLYAAQREEAAREQSSLLSHVFEDPDWISQQIRERLEVAGGRLATHPVGYIGANYRGLGELARLRPMFLKSYNRNSHGTYPVPATWETVGPLATSERVYGPAVPPVHEDWQEREWWDMISDPRFRVYRAQDIELVPDWERVKDLALTDAGVRRRWSWLFLPIRWGFPISPSPGGGTLKHTDLGHVAPEGPAFHATWNRVGAVGEVEVYEPRILRVALVATTPLAGIQNGWGFLNIPLAMAGAMPGYNVAVSQLMPWISGTLQLLGTPPTRTIHGKRLPTRFSSIGHGWFSQSGGADFARLLPTGDGLRLSEGPEAGGLGATDLSRDWSSGERLWLTLYDGRQLSVENTFAWNTSQLSYALLDADRRPLGTVQGSLDVRELTGGFRYRIAASEQGTVSLYTRLGYGWTWYELDQARFNAAGVENSGIEGGYAPTVLPSRRWWPNTWYGGAGVELFAPRKAWLMRVFGYGVRVDFTGLLHRFTTDFPGGRGDGWTERGDASVSLLFGW